MTGHFLEACSKSIERIANIENDKRLRYIRE